MLIRDVMTKGVECIDPEATLVEASKRMRDLEVGALPVCDSDRLGGIVTDRDIVIRCIAGGGDPKQTTVRQAMSTNLRYCFDDQDISECAGQMRDWQVRRLPVINREKRLVGIVALGDLAVHAKDMALAGSALEGISEAD